MNRTWIRSNEGVYYSSNTVIGQDGVAKSDYKILRSEDNPDKWVICYYDTALCHYYPITFIPAFTTVAQARDYILSLDTHNDYCNHDTHDTHDNHEYASLVSI